jgi:cytochrome c5
MSNAHDHAPAVKEKSPQLKKVLATAGLLVPILAIVALVYNYVNANQIKAEHNAALTSPDAIALATGQRIQKVGSITMGDANRPLVSGEEVYKIQCSACHATGAAGSPKFQDAGAWGPRIGTGFATLVNSALKGKGNMGPQGGGNYSDIEIARGVAYMANAAGAKFAEPQPPAAAASGAAPAASAASTAK